MAAIMKRLNVRPLRKVGGLWHWRLGRIGGSFYLSTLKAAR